MKKIVNYKKYIKVAIVAGIFLFAGAFVFFGTPHPSDAQTSAYPNSTVPQFGMNIGDYSSCLNQYVEDNGTPGNLSSGNWTPPDGGLQTGVSGINNFGAGDCIQAGMAVNNTNSYTVDFKVGIRVAPYTTAGATRSGNSTNGLQCNWADAGAWVYTPWASAGGGASGLSVLQSYAAGIKENWGVECSQLSVVTAPLPAGISLITSPHFSITIAHVGNPDGDNGARATSYAYSPCYLDSNAASWDRGAPTPSCSLQNVGGGGNFWSASVELDTTAIGATVVSNNIPTSFTPSETKTIGTDGNPLQVTMKNTGNLNWFAYNSTVLSQSGTCDTGGTYDCPDVSKPQGTSCTVQLNNWSSFFQLQHTGAFGASSNPAAFSHQTSATCTVGAVGCSNTDSACSGDEYSCESAGVCNGGSGSCSDETSCQLPQEFGGCGGSWTSCGGTWGPQYTFTQSGPADVVPGATATFNLGSLTAPAASGVYNEKWQMTSLLLSGMGYGNMFGNGPFGTPLALNITVTPGAPTSTVSGVTVTCTPTTISITGTSQCTAVVNPGMGSPSQTVSWSATDGTITSGGLFTPNAPGTATITAQSTQDPTKSGSAPITVNGLVGTINVVSENSALSSVLVPASWSFSSPTAAADPCGGDGSHGGSCTNVTNATYGNEPGGMYAINPGYAPGYTSFIAPSGYAFKSIEQVPIAGNTNSFVSKLLSFGKNIISTPALAWTFPAGSPPAQNLVPPGSINFIILWQPTANMTLSQSTMTPSASAGGSVATSVISLSNTGAPGSTLTWGATSNQPWLSVSPSSNSTGLTNGASGFSSQNITVTANPGSLSPGTYTGTVTFNGSSTIDKNPIYPPQTLTVTFTVAPAGGGSGFNCVNNACKAVASGAAYSTAASCNAACSAPAPSCGGPSGPCAACSLTASPSTIVVPQSTKLNYNCTAVTSCTLSGGALTPPVSISANSSNAVTGSTSVTPSTNTTYTLSCQGSNGGSTNNTVQVNVGNSILCESNPGGTNCPQ